MRERRRRETENECRREVERDIKNDHTMHNDNKISRVETKFDHGVFKKLAATRGAAATYKSSGRYCPVG